MVLLFTLAAIVLAFYFFGFAIDLAGGFIHLLLLVVVALVIIALVRGVDRNR